MIHATKTKTGAWPNEFQVYILSKMLQLRIVIIQSSWDEGLIQIFNTDDSSFIFHGSELEHSSSSNFSKASTGNKTCYLLQFDEAIPHGMCHWTQTKFNHFVYLQDDMEEISDEDKKRAYKGRGGTQDIGWHPLIVNPWSNLLEEAVLDNNASIGSQPLINDIAEDPKEDGPALVGT